MFSSDKYLVSYTLHEYMNTYMNTCIHVKYLSLLSNINKIQMSRNVCNPSNMKFYKNLFTTSPSGIWGQTGRYGKVNAHIFATIYCTCIKKVLHSLNTEKREYVKWFCSSTWQVEGTVQHFVTEFKYLSSTVTWLVCQQYTFWTLMLAGPCIIIQFK
jgi:hypothetical protein